MKRLFLWFLSLLLLIGTCVPAYASGGSTGSGTGSGAGGAATPPLQSGNMQF